MESFDDLSARARSIAEHLLSLGAAPTAPAAPTIDYPRLQQRVHWLDGILRLYRAAAQAIADQVADEAADQAVIDASADAARDDDRALAFVHRAHRLLLEHPIAAKQAYAALAREGRSYAETAEGAALRDRLLRSPRLRRASLLWRSLTMGMLDEDDPGELPSAYLDNLLRAVDRSDLERLLGRLHLERPRR